MIIKYKYILAWLLGGIGTGLIPIVTSVDLQVFMWVVGGLLAALVAMIGYTWVGINRRLDKFDERLDRLSDRLNHCAERLARLGSHHED